uniref:zinc finger protein 836-like n=1 Tax=Styela clava TaxID=7725 RepID=UPI00193ADBFA|nr:zinc finger protein 836-like [Styela clava]
MTSEYWQYFENKDVPEATDVQNIASQSFENSKSKIDSFDQNSPINLIHMKNYHGIKNDESNKCAEIVAVNESQETRLPCNSKSLTCHICDLKLCHKASLKRHMRRHLGIKNHKCDRCNRTFGENYTLIKHQKTHLRNRDKHGRISIKTLFQSKTMIGNNESDDEIVTTDNPDGLKDEYNQFFEYGEDSETADVQYFASQSLEKPNLRRHQQLVHLQNSEQHGKIYSKSTCDKNSIKGNLCQQSSCITKHPKIQEINKRVCAVCEKVFPRPYLMRNHLYTVHATEKRFKCEICTDKSFATGMQLIRNCETKRHLRNKEELENPHLYII